MLNLKNPHDLLFKETLSHKENVVNFLENYLPEELLEIINLKELELEKDSFVTAEMREFFTDLLYQTEIAGSEGYIYFLFEHKSYLEGKISLQLLQYMLECWKTKIKQEEEKLPVILPLVIYHGQKDWEIPIKISDLLTVRDSRLLKYIPDFEYLLYEIKNPGFDSEKAKENLRIMLELFRYTGNDVELWSHIREILSLLKKEQGIDYEFLKTITIYIYNVFEIDMEEYIEEVSRILTAEGGEIVMTTAQRLFLEGEEKGRLEGRLEGERKGRLEGRLEGEKKGRLEAEKNLAMKLLKKKFGDIPESLRTRLEAVDEPEILERIVEEIFNIDKTEDVLRFL